MHKKELFFLRKRLLKTGFWVLVRRIGSEDHAKSDLFQRKSAANFQSGDFSLKRHSARDESCFRPQAPETVEGQLVCSI